MSLFGRSERASTQRIPFEEAITKSADILRDHPDSKWVDDAILIIGKAWFFTLNFVGAEGKFNEILALDSPLHEEARFWLARTLIASGAYDEAFSHLQSILSVEDVSQRWEPRYRLALAELHVQRENWEEAAVETQSGLDALRDPDLAGRALFLLGQVYEQLGQFEDAIRAYNRVQRHKPFYELSYAAQYSSVRVQALHGDPNLAMVALRRMERDDKNYDHRAELAYLRGRVLMALGYHEDALTLFEDLLYDRHLGGTQVRGPVHYAMGEFFRDIHKDYPYAAAHFDTASRTLRAPARARSATNQNSRAQPAPGAIVDSEDQARILGSYAEVLNRLTLLDSLLYLGALDDSSFQAVVLELRKRRADEIAETERDLRRRQAESAFVGAGDPRDEAGGVGGSQTAGTEGEAGFLFHKEPLRMEQARQDFVLVWGDRPLAPNWRRIAAIEAMAASEEGFEEGSDFVAVEVDPAADLPEVDVSAVPRDSVSTFRMEADRASARYELANVLFLSMAMPDSAAFWYRTVIEEDGDKEVAQRAYYALAELQLALGDSLAADRLYAVILDLYPHSDFVGQAAERLSRPVPVVAQPDSLIRAEAVYRTLLEQWEAGDLENAMTGLWTAGLDWSTTEVAPRALLAAGRVFLEWAERDSLDVLGPLPTLIPRDRLVHAQIVDPPDSTGAAEAVTLDRLLGHIGAKYPQALQKDQADRIVDALEEQRAELKSFADSLAQAEADSIALVQAQLDSLAIAQSAVIPTADSVAFAAENVLQRSDSVAGVVQDSLEARMPGPRQFMVAPSDSLKETSVAEIPDPSAAVDARAKAGLSGQFPDPREASPAQELDARKESAEEIQLAENQTGENQASELLAEEALSASAEEFALLESAAEEEASEGPLAEPLVADQMGEGHAGDALAESESVVEGNALLRDPSLGNLDWSQGGYTIQVGAFDRHEMAVGFVQNYGRSLSDVPHAMDIFGAEVENGVEFRVGLGLFETRQQAESVQQALAGRITGDARIVRLGA